MAWARVCASCCRQLAEAVLPAPAGVGAEERMPLLGPAPASHPQGSLILKDPGTPDFGLFCSPDGVISSDPLSGAYREVGLHADSSSTCGSGATRESWPAAALLADLEQEVRQWECALPRAAPPGLAPLKPEASLHPACCMGVRGAAEAGMRDLGSASPGPEGCLPGCHSAPQNPESRRGQLPTVPGGPGVGGRDQAPDLATPGRLLGLWKKQKRKGGLSWSSGGPGSQPASSEIREGLNAQGSGICCRVPHGVGPPFLPAPRPLTPREQLPLSGLDFVTALLGSHLKLLLHLEWGPILQFLPF